MWLCQKFLTRFLYFRLQLAFYSLHAMTSTEHTHQETRNIVNVFRGIHLGEATDVTAPASNEVYFRLNVTDMGAKVDLDAWQKMRNLQDLAVEYMGTDFGRSTKEVIAARLYANTGTKPPQTRWERPIDYSNIEAFVIGSGEEKKYVLGLIDAGAENFVSNELISELGILRSPLKANEIPELMTPSNQCVRPESRVQLAFSLAHSSVHCSESFFVVGRRDLPKDMILGSKLVLEDGRLWMHFEARELSPLLRAVKRGDENLAKLLLETGKLDVDPKDNDGRTPLWWAAGYGSEAVVKLLLETGKADVDSKDNDGRTPLSWAARHGRKAVVKLLQSFIDT